MLILALVLFISILGIYFHLSVSGRERSIIALDVYVSGAAVTLAAGQGFFEPDTDYAPVIASFLRGDIDSIPLGDLPADIPKRNLPAAASSEYHLYLNYTTALFWRLFGISRRSLEPLAAIMFSWTALAVYGLMRLLMRKSFAFFFSLAFMFSPPILTMCGHIRDFSKAPFLLTLVFLLVLLIRHRFGRLGILLISISLGIVNGTAMGFRQDALVFFPITIAMLIAATFSNLNYSVLGPVRKSLSAIKTALFAPAVYSILFFLIASPMLGKMEGGADPYHPLVQGFSIKNMDNLGIRSGLYIPHSSGQDNYTFNTYYHYYRRANKNPEAHFAYDSAGSATAGRQWLIDMGIRFPADIATVIYASVLRTLRYADAYTMLRFNIASPIYGLLHTVHIAIANHLHLFGLLYALIALLILSSNSLYAAFSLFFLGFYLCGYAGLQAELRHTFHLTFVPYLIIGFLLNCVFTCFQFLVRCLRTRAKRIRIVPFKAPLFRVSVFAVLTLAMILFPLQSLSVDQTFSAAATVRRCIYAERSPLPFTRTNSLGWTTYDLIDAHATKDIGRRDIEALFEVMSLLTKKQRFPRPLSPRYIVVEFDGAKVPDFLFLRYESLNFWSDFSQLLRLPEIKNAHGAVFHAFPVYEMLTFVDGIFRTRFQGIAIPDEFSDSVKAIYETDDISSFPFLMPLTWAQGDDLKRPLFYFDPSKLPLHQALDFFPDPIFYEFVPHSTLSFYNAADTAEQQHRYREASLLHGLYLLSRVPSIQDMHIIRKLIDVDALTTALEGLSRLGTLSSEQQKERIRLLHEIAVCSIEREAKHSVPNQMEDTRAALAQLMEIHSEAIPEILLNIGDTLKKCHFYDRAYELFLELLITYPDHDILFHHVNISLTDMTSPKSAFEFWTDVSKASPDTFYPWFYLGVTCERIGKMQDAINAYQKALLIRPDSSDALIRLENASRLSQ